MPGILEAVRYRFSDGTAARDADLGLTTTGGGPGGRTCLRGCVTDEQTWTFCYADGGNEVLPNGWESEESSRVSYKLCAHDPLSAGVLVEVESVLRRGSQGRFHIVTRGEMTCDAHSFFVTDDVSGREGEEGVEREVFAKSWRRGQPRDFV